MDTSSFEIVSHPTDIDNPYLEIIIGDIPFRVYKNSFISKVENYISVSSLRKKQEEEANKQVGEILVKILLENETYFSYLKPYVEEKLTKLGYIISQYPNNRDSGYIITK